MKFFFSIKTKMILAITALMAVIFLMIAFLFINEKKIELADDIYMGVKTFAELTAPAIADNVELYLNEEGFVNFNKEIKKIFEQNKDVEWVKVVSYGGEIVYDSEVDVEKKYEEGDEGLARMVNFENEMYGGCGVVCEVQLKSELPSFSLLCDDEVSEGGSCGIIFLKENDFVRDLEGKLDYNPKKGFKITSFVQPASDKYSVVYGVTYANMEERIADMVTRIIATAILGLVMGIILAFFMSTKVTKPVRKLVDGASEIAKGNFKYHVEIKSRDELGYLGESFNKMADDLGASLEARLYKERVGHELELAKKIQQEIIPAKLPSVSGLDVSASVDPATEVGGDIYDVIPVSGSETVMYLGDVTGHGVPSCIVSAIASSLLFSYSGLLDLKEILKNVNSVLKKKMMTTMFMTLGIVKWNSESGRLSYVNAGHEPLMVCKAGGSAGAGGGISMIDSGKGIALGMVPDISEKLNEVSVEFGVGDVAVLFSDGIVEAWKNDKESYGVERLKEIVKKSSGLSADEIRKAILEDVRIFTAGFEQKDDVTVMVVRRG